MNNKQKGFLLISFYILVFIFYSNRDLLRQFTVTMDKSEADETQPRVFCIILTTEANLKSKAKIVYDTWAHKCNNHKMISLISPSNKSIDSNTNLLQTTRFTQHRFNQIKYESLFDVLQPEELVVDTYQNLTNKIYSSFKHVYNNHPDYDWYLKADDDSFFFMANLRTFLKSKNPNLPVTYGYDFKTHVFKGYHSGDCD